MGRLAILCSKKIHGETNPPESTPKVSRDHPVVISKYITGAKEVEMDGIGKATKSLVIETCGNNGAWLSLSCWIFIIYIVILPSMPIG